MFYKEFAKETRLVEEIVHKKKKRTETLKKKKKSRKKGKNSQNSDKTVPEIGNLQQRPINSEDMSSKQSIAENGKICRKSKKRLSKIKNPKRFSKKSSDAKQFLVNMKGSVSRGSNTPSGERESGHYSDMADERQPSGLAKCNNPRSTHDPKKDSLRNPKPSKKRSRSKQQIEADPSVKISKQARKSSKPKLRIETAKFGPSDTAKIRKSKLKSKTPLSSQTGDLFRPDFQIYRSQTTRSNAAPDLNSFGNPREGFSLQSNVHHLTPIGLPKNPFALKSNQLKPVNTASGLMRNLLQSHALEPKYQILGPTSPVLRKASEKLLRPSVRLVTLKNSESRNLQNYLKRNSSKMRAKNLGGPLERVASKQLKGSVRGRNSEFLFSQRPLKWPETRGRHKKKGSSPVNRTLENKCVPKTSAQINRAQNDHNTTLQKDSPFGK